MDLFIGVEARRVFCVNSRAAWDTIVTYGDRLRQWMKLYSYLFCYDIDDNGYLVGFPSMFFDRTIQHVDGIFTDNKNLVSELNRIYRLPESLSRKVHCVYHSIRDRPWPEPHCRKLLDRAPADTPWRIFWGGRIDKQKRFDIVIEVARKLPEIEFRAWGMPVLEDVHFDLNALPANLHYEGVYEAFEELPLSDCDIWLYTSAWDGLPSILIEAGMRGIATVASRVGGVGELISQETGYPVEPAGEVDAYVAQIKQLTADPAEAARRGTSLWELTRHRHSPDRYAAAIGQVLERLEADN